MHLFALAAEGHVCDTAGSGNDSDANVVLKPTEVIPQANAPPENDRDDCDVQIVDQPGPEEFSGGRRTAGHADTSTSRNGGCLCKGIGRWSCQKVEDGAARHRDRRTLLVSENEDGDPVGSAIGVEHVNARSCAELAATPGTGPYGPAERPMGGCLRK